MATHTDPRERLVVLGQELLAAEVEFERFSQANQVYRDATARLLKLKTDEEKRAFAEEIGPEQMIEMLVKSGEFDSLRKRIETARREYTLLLDTIEALTQPATGSPFIDMFEASGAESAVREMLDEANKGDSPLAIVCPNCQAAAFEPCTQPTDTGRKIVGWFHHARTDAVA